MNRSTVAILGASIVGLLSWLATTCAPAAAQGNPVPPVASEAFDRGLAAAEQQQWPLAIRYFRDAQKAAPAAPSILFNLGLAHAKAGQELPAIAWLQAYLAAERQATNAEAVRKEIVRLEIATEAKIARILQEALAAAATTGTKQSVLYTQASVGDVEGALKGGFEKGFGAVSAADLAWSAYAFLLASTWLVEKAEEAVRRVSDVPTRDHVYSTIGEALIERTFWSWAPYNLYLSFPRSAGDFDLARAAASRIVDPAQRAQILVKALTEDFRAGDVPLAEKAIAEVPQGFDVELLLIAMVKHALQVQDFDGAARFAERLLRVGARRSSLPFSGSVSAIRAIFDAQLARGDVAGARMTARRLLPAATGLHRTTLEAVLGNYEPARALLPTLKCNLDEKVGVFKWIMSTQASSDDVAGAKASMKAAASACGGEPVWGDERIYASTLIDALLRKRDLPGALAAVKETGQGATDEGTIEFVRRTVRVDELVAIERAAPDLLKHPFWRARLQLALADAYEARRVGTEAARLRLQAARFYLANPQQMYESNKTVVKMARALEASGDAAGARAIFAMQPPNPLVVAWGEAAIKLSSDDLATDLAKVVKSAGALKPSDAASKLGEISVALAGRLFALRGAALRAKGS